MLAKDIGHRDIVKFLELMESFSRTVGKENFKSFMTNFEKCTAPFF